MAFKISTINLDRLKVQNLYNTYLGMTPRDQTIAMIAAAVVLVMVILLPVMVASNKITKLEKSIDDGNGRIKDIMYAIEEVGKAQQALLAMESTLAGGFDTSISTTLENLASKNGISDRIDSLKEKPVAPSDLLEEASVDVRLKKLTLQEVVDYLYAIEQNPEKLLRLKRLEIKPRFDNPREFDVSFQVSTYRLLESSSGGG